MIEYEENDCVDRKDNLLSPSQRDSLHAVRAPEGLGGRIQQRLLELRPALQPVLQRVGMRQLTAAGLLGFLSFFGAQVLITQLGDSPANLSLEAANPSQGAETKDSVANFHLSGVALLSDSDYYVDTLPPPESTPEVVLATYMHERGAKR
mgnify:CR=1 FL=1